MSSFTAGPGNIFDPPASGMLTVIRDGGVIGSSGELSDIDFRPVEMSLNNLGTATLQTSQPSQGIPEPLSVVCTLIGGSAVWRIRKKLMSNKVKVSS